MNLVTASKCVRQKMKTMKGELDESTIMLWNFTTDFSDKINKK